jgi:threonine dehydrogenase-like Zn-dependent dehydrogenase
MKQYEITSVGEGRVSEVQTPSPGPNEVLVRVISVGLCASDLPIWSTEQAAYPIALGHEPVGEVVEIGTGAEVSVGSIVTGRLFPSFAEYVVADMQDIVIVPPQLEAKDVIAEPLGCVAEAFRRTPIATSDRVAVIGLGFMGLLMVQLLAHSPQAEIVGIDLREDARAFAIANGANAAVAPSEVPESWLAPSFDDAYLDRGFDVVIEASGSQPGLDLASQLVRAHGVLTILGYHQGARTVQMGEWNWKALEVVNGHVRDRDLLRESTRRGVEAISAGKVDLSSLITHRFALDETDQAFELLRSKPHGFIKAVIDIGR